MCAYVIILLLLRDNPRVLAHLIKTLGSNLDLWLQFQIWQSNEFCGLEAVSSISGLKTPWLCYVKTGLLRALHAVVSPSSLAHLQLVQKAADYRVGQREREREWSHYSSVGSLTWLTVYYRIHHAVALFVFKALRCLAPAYVADKLHMLLMYNLHT